MTPWEVFEIIVFIAGFLAIVIKISNVIQKNTDAINSLTSEISDLSTTNKKDHKYFHEKINHLDTEVEVMKTKHDSDIQLINTKIEKEYLQ